MKYSMGPTGNRLPLKKRKRKPLLDNLGKELEIAFDEEARCADAATITKARSPRLKDFGVMLPLFDGKSTTLRAMLRARTKGGLALWMTKATGTLFDQEGKCLTSNVLRLVLPA